MSEAEILRARANVIALAAMISPSQQLARAAPSVIHELEMKACELDKKINARGRAGDERTV